MSLNKRHRKYVAALNKRRECLVDRVFNKEDPRVGTSFDRVEASALKWALKQLCTMFDLDEGEVLNLGGERNGN